MMDAILQVRHLRKHYPTRHGPVQAVDDVSFDVPTGRTVALVGESGCGKSTVALALLRLIVPDAGSVRFEDVDFNRVGEAQRHRLRRRISIVFQNPYSSLNPKMRVRDIVGEPLKTAFGLRGGVLSERVVRHLEEVGLGSEHMKRYPHEFSGGQRQRIAIARALALEPRLLVLDEPTAALDVSVQAQVLNLLRRLQTRLGLSYLFISHNLAVVEYVADDVLVMYLGRIVEVGAVREVFRRPWHPYTRALLDSIPVADPSLRERLHTLPGEVPSPLRRPRGCAFAPRCAHAREDCRQMPPALQPRDDRRRVACFHPLDGEIAQ
jgi:oligopeptide/dipeptide ABC transporter ATP-binding protein